jgi:hypothetical protein
MGQCKPLLTPMAGGLVLKKLETMPTESEMIPYQ